MKLHLSKRDQILVYIFTIGFVIVGTLYVLGGTGGIQGSVINGSGIIYTKPNQTDINSYLQSAGVNVPKFGIQTSVVLFDSNGVQHPFSSILPLTPNTLVDSKGNLLDTGKIQVQFLAVGTPNQQMIVTGQMYVYLDDELIQQNPITGQGTLTGSSLPLLVNGLNTFDFTLSDEGLTWKNNTSHAFRIYLSNIQATVGTGLNTNTYSYYGNYIAYVLNLLVNNDKIVEKNAITNQAVSVYKSDVQLITKTNKADIKTSCSAGSTGGVSCSYSEFTGTLPDVKVLDNGFVIGSGSNITNLPRNEVLTFTINGIPVTVKTPLTSYTYIITCTPQAPEGMVYTVCLSNFGWSGRI